MRSTLTKNTAPAALLAFSTALAGCNIDMNFNGPVEGVPFAEFEMPTNAPTAIDLIGPDNIIISEGEQFAMTLDGESDAQEAMRFHLDGDELTIGRDSDVYDGSESAIIRITMPAPSRLEVAGSGTIKSDALAAEDARVGVNGAGEIIFASITGNELDAEINGSGDITGAGEVDSLNAEINGSGDIDLKGLSTQTASAEINGSGDIAFASDGSVDGEINGSGDIVVTGSASCSSDINGSGSLRCKPAVDVAQSPAIADESTAEADGDPE